MRKISKIIIHCADTKPSMDVGVAEIRVWHTQERGFSDIGYHYVIRKSGEVETGRDEKIPGAHCRGYNRASIGICYVGGFGGVDDRTEAQNCELENLVRVLKDEHPEATVHGHNEFSDKSCPNFDVQEWIKQIDL